MKPAFNAKSMSKAAVMAALCFIGTTYLMIMIPTPLGGARFHFGDVFCLMAALLFGPLTGGLSGAIGMSLSDLVTGYAIYAPSTFIFRLVQGSLCGLIAWPRAKNGEVTSPGLARSAAACAIATVAYIILFMGYHFIEKRYMWQAEMGTVLTDMAFRLGNSSIKAVMNVIITILLTPVFRTALRRAGTGWVRG
ncbi:MAG: ECF transporter S component [Oscillospiraceae bacterium]|jgi:uncharacterized membrane protein|nr:ECF transporter S component [Oscillospiraceae bacterium]